MNDYTYLLKSIKFPKEEMKIIPKKESKEIDENTHEISSKNEDNENNKYKKLFSFEDNHNNLKEIKEKEESDSEEYEGLKPKNLINNKNKKRK